MNIISIPPDGWNNNHHVAGEQSLGIVDGSNLTLGGAVCVDSYVNGCHSAQGAYMLVGRKAWLEQGLICPLCLKGPVQHSCLCCLCQKEFTGKIWASIVQ